MNAGLLGSGSSTSINMDSIMDNYAYLGMDIRNDGYFCPGAFGPTYNGQIHYMNDSRDMGSNFDPWNTVAMAKGFYQVAAGYKPGLGTIRGSKP